MLIKFQVVGVQLSPPLESVRSYKAAAMAADITVAAA